MVVKLLDIDAGELDTETEELWSCADILCVACGGHAGDARSMEKLARFCHDRGKTLAAHPSYPDRARFGRVSVTMDANAIAAFVEEQCAELASVAETCETRVDFVKPHGALYHDANASLEIARAIVRGAKNALGDFGVIGPARGALADASKGHRYLREAFADRRTRDDGTLVPRTEMDALLTDPTEAARVARTLDADVICVHGDTENAIAIARAVREALR